MHPPIRHGLHPCNRYRRDSKPPIKETSETAGDAEPELSGTETVEMDVVTEISEAVDAIGTEETSESIEAETETGVENVLETEYGGTETSQTDITTGSDAGTETENQSVDGENNESDSSSETGHAVNSYTVTSLNKTMYVKQAVNVRRSVRRNWWNCLTIRGRTGATA